MNRFISFFVLCLPLMLVAAPMDTVKVFNHPNQVIIAEDSVGVMMRVAGNDGSNNYDYVYRNEHRSNEQVVTTQTDGGDVRFKLPFQKTDTAGQSDFRRHFEFLISGLYFGWGGLHVNSGYRNMADYNKGMHEWGLLHLIAMRWQPFRHHWLTIGLGLESRSYKMRSAMRLVTDEQHVTLVRPFDEGVIDCKSALNMESLQLPITYTLPIVKELRFSVGPVIDFNLRARIRNTYKTFDTSSHEQTITDEYRKLGVKRVSLDLLAALHYDGLGIYARYRPMNVFRNDYGPQFNNWSLGLMISF